MKKDKKCTFVFRVKFLLLSQMITMDGYSKNKWLEEKKVKE